MRRWILLTILVVPCFWAVHKLVIQYRDYEWSSTYQRASAELQAHHFSEAENLILGILPDTQHRWPHSSRLADTLKLLGNAYLADHKFSEAIAYHTKAIEVYKSALPSNGIELARIETGLAILYRDQDRSAEAERYFSESLTTFDENPNYTGVEIAWDLHNMGVIRAFRGELREAEPILQRCIGVYEAVGTRAAQADLAEAHFHFADVLRKEGKNDQAEMEFKKSLELQQSTRGPNAPQVAYVLNGLALVYQDEGKNTAARQLLQRAMEVERSSSAPREPDGITLNNLGLAAEGAGNYSEAETLFRKAITIVERDKGPEAPTLAAPLDNLGCLYRDHEQFDLNAAEALLQRALSIREKALGSDHPDTAITLSNLSLTYFYQQKPDLAEQFAERALPIQQRTYGPDSLEVSTALNRLGLAQRDQRKFKEAEKSLREALSIREKKLGTDHEWVAISLGNLASVYLAEGKDDVAKPLLLRAQAIRGSHPNS